MKEKKFEKLIEALLWWLGRLDRAKFWYLASRTDIRTLNALNIFLHSTVSMCILGIAAHLTSWPLIFPSLGPTIFLLFYAPSSPMSAPRNTILSHLMGAGIGWTCHALLLHFMPESASAEITEPCKIVTAALALGTCGVFMSFTGIVHPPAASTTLIAGLGLMHGPLSIVMIGISVFFLCVQAWVMHNIAGIKYPLWTPFSNAMGPDITTRLGKLSTASGGDTANPARNVAARLASRQKLK